MRFPLDNYDSFKYGYKFKEWTFYKTEHLGIDKITPIGTPVLAPSKGKIVSKVNGKQMGLTVHFIDENNKLWRFGHLVKWSEAWGDIKEGDILGWTGNTGDLSTAPHLHYDVSIDDTLVLNINHFQDPEIYIKSNQHNNDYMEIVNGITKEIMDKDKRNETGQRAIAKSTSGKLYVLENNKKREVANINDQMTWWLGVVRSDEDLDKIPNA